ncbi:MarR family winged helix-turn-helix transcriptional regulator [Parvularcula sp. IMCC14364]|uniref:MarR family winged helix-turn-helix transcriptional regulator n=1 Tax=Parvularcula sp. IMCC14364 TaxID=3067902 RepID=UPI002740914E|nr:MarR family transcriptional regulator [Parvularcula sp. IMCC14364]
MSERSDAALIALRQILRATEINSRALAKSSGLTPSQLILLQVLSKSGKETAGRIAKEVSLSQATVTTLIDKLEARGAVTRCKDEQDKRRVMVELTGIGRATLEETPDSLQERFEIRFQKLADWEQSFLIAALERVALLLDAEDLDAAPVLDVGGIATPGT